MGHISNPADLRCRGMEILVRELGYVDAMRFLRQCEAGAGDYTLDRDRMLPDWSNEELLRRADESSRAAKRE